MSDAGVAMATEIREGPASMASAFAATIAVAPARPRGVVVFARGSSDNAAAYGRYLIEDVAGLPVVLGAPSLATAYRADTDFSGWLAIGVSQSGATREIVDCLQWASGHGALTLAITNDPGSQLAGAADVSVDLGCGEERAVAATKTFLAEGAALAALAYGWSERSADWVRLAEVGAAVAEGPVDEPLVEALAEADVLAVLGRGYRYPIALELALKLMEACRVWATGMSWADLLHGPITAVPAGSSCLLLGDRGPLAESSTAIEAKLAELGARVIPAPAIEAGGVEEPLLPLLEALACQRPILEAARRRGLDPDRPEGLTKVTQT